MTTVSLIKAPKYAVAPAGDGVYLITGDPHHKVHGIFFPDTTAGWWRGVDVHGHPRRVWVEPDEEDPVQQLLAKMTRI